MMPICFRSGGWHSAGSGPWWRPLALPMLWLILVPDSWTVCILMLRTGQRHGRAARGVGADGGRVGVRAGGRGSRLCRICGRATEPSCDDGRRGPSQSRALVMCRCPPSYNASDSEQGDFLF